MGVDSVESQQVEKESYFYVPTHPRLEWSMVISRLAKHYFSPLKISLQGGGEIYAYLFCWKFRENSDLLIFFL